MAKKKIEEMDVNELAAVLLPNDKNKSLRVEPLNDAFVVMFGDSYVSKSGHICELAIDAHFYPTKVKAQQAVDFMTQNIDFLKF